MARSRPDARMRLFVCHVGFGRTDGCPAMFGRRSVSWERHTCMGVECLPRLLRSFETALAMELESSIVKLIGAETYFVDGSCVPWSRVAAS